MPAYPAVSGHVISDSNRSASGNSSIAAANILPPRRDTHRIYSYSHHLWRLFPLAGDSTCRSTHTCQGARNYRSRDEGIGREVSSETNSSPNLQDLWYNKP